MLFLIGSVINLPFADSSCPKVISTQVWEHLPQPSDHAMLQEVHRVLHEKGFFALNLPGPLFLEQYRYTVYKLVSLLCPGMKQTNETLRRYWEQNTYDAYGINQRVRPGFYPWEVASRAA